MLDGTTMQRILYDIAAGRAPEKYTAEMLSFRAKCAAEYEAAKAINPNVELYIPAELPDF